MTVSATKLVEMTEDEKIRASIPCVTVAVLYEFRGKYETHIVSLPEGVHYLFE